MNSDTIRRLEAYLKQNVGNVLPEIRFFDGATCFADRWGNYRSDSLEESIKLFLTEKGF